MHSDFYQQVLEAITEGIQVVDQDWRYLYVNAAAAQHGRRNQEDFVGKTMMELYPGIDQTPMFERLQHCMSNKESVRMENHFHYPDGESGWFFLSFDARAEGVIIRSIDISKEKELEHRFRHLQKMEALSRLAGGIAHDFNNILTTILIETEVLLDDLSLTHPMRSSLERILESAERSARLTKQLLTFSRRQPTLLETIDLNQHLINSEHFLKRLIGPRIKLRFELRATHGQVLMDPSQLEQVIMNLVVNAKDAMSDTGELTLSTEEAPTEVVAAIPELSEGRYVVFCLEDTGQGMTQEVQARLFEPYFTTKEVGKGTGLGLATVHGIVHQAKGAIRFHSVPNLGTRFWLYLPLVESASTQQSHQVERAGLSSANRYKILLVDDDLAIRQTIQGLLEKHGHQVLSCANAEECLKAYPLDLTSFPFDLILSDMQMKEMSGRDLVMCYKECYPELKVMLMSGYHEEDLSKNDENIHFVQKPIGREALLKAIKDVMEN